MTNQGAPIPFAIIKIRETFAEVQLLVCTSEDEHIFNRVSYFTNIIECIYVTNSFILFQKRVTPFHLLSFFFFYFLFLMLSSWSPFLRRQSIISLHCIHTLITACIKMQCNHLFFSILFISDPPLRWELFSVVLLLPKFRMQLKYFGYSINTCEWNKQYINNLSSSANYISYPILAHV